MSGSKVVILGGTGIIGSELSRAAAMLGHEVTVVSRGHNRALREMSVDIPGLEVILADALDQDSLVGGVGGRRFDVVVDLLSFDAQQLSSKLAVLGKVCDQYIFVSSSTIFDGGTSDAPITEESPMTSSGWSYPEKKIGAERYLRSESLKTGLPFTIVRPYITYSSQRVPFGFWESDIALRLLMKNLPIPVGRELSETPTALMHSKDMAYAVSLLIANPDAMGEDFNVAAEESVTWGEVYAMAASITGSQSPLVLVDDREVVRVFSGLEGKAADRLLPRVFDTHKLREVIPGYQTQVSLRAGLERVIPQHLAAMTCDLEPGHLGRIDRLVADAGMGRALRAEKREQLKKLSAKASAGYHLRYEMSRSPILSSMKNSMKATARRILPGNSPYGVS
ncbi:MAG: NAD-dependent epimerase/dehydratase family protein [Ancrocorticia sp.]